MKKFFYLMAFVCTLSLFTACSSDDDPVVPTVWDTYQGGSYDVWVDQVDTEDGLSEDNFNLKLNVAKGDNNMAKLTITGDVNATVPAATISQDGDNIKVSGEGTATVTEDDGGNYFTSTIGKKPTTLISRADVTKTIACQVSAVINTAKNTVTLSMTATDPETGKKETLTTSNTVAKSPLYGVWNVEPAVEGEDYNFTGSVKINWQFKEDAPEDTVASANYFLNMGESMANQILPQVLKSVAFTSDGKIYAEYADLPKQQDTEADEPTATTPAWKVADGYATYKIVDDNHITVFLDNKKITSGIQDKPKKATVETILGLFKDGIPVNVRFSNNNKTAFFYIDKEFTDKLKENTVLTGFVNNLKYIKDDDFNGWGVTIKAIVPMVKSWIENADKIEAGIELVK